jgi:hypothetical protein
LPIDVATISRQLQKEGMHCRIAAKKELLTNAQKEQRMAFATAYADKDEQWGWSVIFSDEKTFGWDFFIFEMVLCIYLYIFMYIIYLYTVTLVNFLSRRIALYVFILN